MYRFVLCRAAMEPGTPTTEVVYGELTNATDRQIGESVHGIPSVSLSIRLDHVLANAVLNEECRLKVYRGAALIFHGPIVTVEEVGDNNARTVKITAAGAWWYATKRLIPETLDEVGEIFSHASSVSLLMETMLGAANGRFTGDWAERFTGIEA
jgi:hypothetical protein